MAMKQVNAAQKKWMENIAFWAEQNLGVLYDGYCGGQYHLHHVVGRSAKHNKVEIGHWFIIPVPVELHDVSSNHPLNVTYHKHKFTDKYGLQSELFSIMIADMEREGFTVPSMEIYNAIVDTRI